MALPAPSSGGSPASRDPLVAPSLESTNQLAARAAREGDPSFAALYERVAPAVRAWVRLRLGSVSRGRIDFEDVEQEIWTRALRAFPAFDPARGSFRGWIFQMTKFALADSFRMLARESRDGTTGAAGAERSTTADGLAQLADPATTVARRVAGEEGLERFLAEVDALPREDRELVAMCGLEGRPTTEAAPLLGLSPETARKRWQRLRARLAERVDLARLIE